MKYSYLRLTALLSLILSISYQPICGQVLGEASAIKDNTIQTYDTRFKGVKGSPYLFPTWLKGTLVSANGDIFQDIDLKYQMVTGELVLKNLSGNVVTLSHDQVDEFYIYDKGVTYFFKAFPRPAPNKKEASMYCQVLLEGGVQLLVKRAKYFVPADRDNASYNDQMHDEYKYKKDQYFLKKEGDSTPIKLNRGTKAILKYLGSYQDELKSFVKSRKLSLMRDEDLIRLLKEYNLLKQNDVE